MEAERRVLVICDDERQAGRIMAKLRYLVPGIRFEFGLREGKIDLAAWIPKFEKPSRPPLRSSSAEESRDLAPWD